MVGGELVKAVTKTLAKEAGEGVAKTASKTVANKLAKSAVKALANGSVSALTGLLNKGGNNAGVSAMEKVAEYLGNQTPTLSKVLKTSAKVDPNQLSLLGSDTPEVETGVAKRATDESKSDNPYAPVGGRVTDAMRERAKTLLKNANDTEIPYNELFERISSEDSNRVRGEIMDSATADKDATEIYGRGRAVYDQLLKRAEENVDSKISVSGAFEDRVKELGEIMGGERYAREALKGYENIDDPTKLKSVTRNIGVREELARLTKELKMSSSDRAADYSMRRGRSGAADTALSERLSVAPGTTLKKNGRFDTPGALGRFASSVSEDLNGKDNIALNKTNIRRSYGDDSDEAELNLMLHERLHAWQKEGKTQETQKKYATEVSDAIDQLREDLREVGAYKTEDEIAERYFPLGGGTRKSLKYWGSIDEQEARMAQEWAERKGYTEPKLLAHSASGRRTGEYEFDEAKVDAAFDKFLETWQDLAKRGIATPSIAAVLGAMGVMSNMEGEENGSTE